jgi:hypothetical protein
MGRVIRYELHKPAQPYHFDGIRNGEISRVHPYGHTEQIVEEGGRTILYVTVNCPFCDTPARANSWAFHRGDIYCPACGARHWQYRSCVPIPDKPLSAKTKLKQALSGL